MASSDDLSAEVATLADAELIERLRSGNLTEGASSIVRRELVERGVDMERALAHADEAVVQPKDLFASSIARFVAIGARVLHFPLRAVLGLEPLWVVLVFGATLNLILFELIVYGLTQFLELRPMPWYPLPIAYVATAVLIVTLAWFAVALWTTAARMKTFAWKSAVRALAVLVALYAVVGTFNRVRVMGFYFRSPSTGESVMDSRHK